MNQKYKIGDQIKFKLDRSINQGCIYHIKNEREYWVTESREPNFNGYAQNWIIFESDIISKTKE